MSGRVALNVSVGVAAFLLSAAAAADPVPVAIWNMDETFGTTMNDSSGNGNNGTLSAGVVTSGAGYIFDGSTAMVVVPDSPTLNPGTQDFSYTVQIQTTVVPADGTDYDVLRKGLSTDSGGDYKIELIRSSGKAKAFCVIRDSSGKQAALTGKTNLADGVLHTVTCARTGKTLTLKVDSLTTLKKKGIAVKSVVNTASLIVGAKSADGGDVENDWYIGTIRSANVAVAPPQ
jgi:hypothetical protein